MPKRAQLHNSLTKGVIDPALSERIDLNHYYNALESGLNIECTPQGGVKRRPGTTIGGRMRRRLNVVPIASAVAPNGGSVSVLSNGDFGQAFLTSTTISGPFYTVVDIDLGSVKNICAVDLINFSRTTQTVNRDVVILYSSNSGYTDATPFGPTFATAFKDTTTAPRTRRWSEAPGGFRAARYWRVALYGNVAGGAFSMGEVRFWTERRQVSPIRGISFTKSSDDLFECVITDRNIDVFKNNVFQSSVPLPAGAEIVNDLEFEQQDDTLLVYHEDLPTAIVTRQVDNDEWDCRPCTYTNVPLLSALGGGFAAGNQYEIQEIRFPGLVNGDQFRIWADDKVGALATYATGNIQGAVNAALSGLGYTLTVTALAEAVPGVRVAQTGGTTGRIPLLLPAFEGLATCTPVTTIVQRGILTSAAAFGSANGYARCGAIYSERQLLCGFRASPSTWGFSRNSLPYDFQETGGTADVAIFGDLPAREVQTIRKVVPARSLHLFTDSAEWFLDTTVIDALSAFNFKYATDNGIKSDVPTVISDGGVLMIQRGGRVLRDLVYSDVELSYKAEPLSLLAPHLLTEVVDMTHRKALTTGEGNQIYMVNAVGDVVFLAFLRAQEVVAMAPWDFGGAVRGMFSDVQFRTWMLVERETVANGADIYMEKLDADHVLDGAVKYSGVATSTVSGLGHFEGAAVWAWADGHIVGPFTVTGGQITLDVAASSIVAGRFPPLRGRLPRLREKLQNGYPWRDPARVYELGISLANTGHLDIAVNGKPFRNVRLAFEADEKLDVANEPARDVTGASTEPTPDLDPSLPILDRLFTGTVRMTNLRGFSKHATIEFSQSIPAPLEIRAIRAEIVHA